MWPNPVVCMRLECIKEVPAVKEGYSGFAPWTGEGEQDQTEGPDTDRSAWLHRACLGYFPVVHLCLRGNESQAKRPAGPLRPETNPLTQLVRCWGSSLTS